MLRTVLLAITFALSASTFAVAESPKRVDVPAGDLAAALQQLAKQADAEFVFSPGELEGARTDGVQGEFTAEGAVSKLLEGTKFRLVKHSSGAFLIKPQSAISASGASNKPDPETKEGGSTSWRMRVAQSGNQSVQQPDMTNTQGMQNVQDSTAESKESSGNKVEEVIVTASRRAQRVQDVVGTLQAFQGVELEKQGADGFTDYLRDVPGLSLRSHSNGTNMITIRGISNVAGIDAGWTTVSTTGIYLNDVPVQGTL